jgi:hypothetical protein
MLWLRTALFLLLVPGTRVAPVLEPGCDAITGGLVAVSPVDRQAHGLPPLMRSV